MSAALPDYQKAAGLIGLAVRARQAITGESACVTAIRTGKAGAALLDGGASENARKRFMDTCAHYQIPLFLFPEGLLGQASGKPGRMALVLSPGNFSKSVLTLLQTAQEG